MHYHAEIIIPPGKDIQESVSEIMGPFNENNDDSLHGFWDFWIIGGRWSGEKMLRDIPKEQIKAFFAQLEKSGITVSPIQCGKQEIKPAAQIPKVDVMWADMFPGRGDVCPLFSHYGNQYENGQNNVDVLPLSQVSDNLTCDTLIIAKPRCDDKTKLEARVLLHESIWNGVTHQDTTFDGNVIKAINEDTEKLSSGIYRAEWAEAHTVKDDWLVVTVDYHS